MVSRILSALLCLSLAACATHPDSPTTGRVTAAPEVLWTFDSGNAIYGNSAIEKGVVYFANIDGKAFALNQNTGKLLWQYESDGPIFSGVHAGKNAVYFQSDDGHTYKIHKQSGKLIWRTKTQNVTQRNYHFGPDDGWDYKSSTPVESDNTVIVGSFDGFVRALNADSGEIEWEFKADGKVQAAPLVTDDGIFFGSWGGVVYALARDDGNLLWKHDTHEDFETPPFLFIMNTEAAQLGKHIFIGGRHTTLFALDKNTGTVAWSYPYVSSWVESPMTVADNTVYAGSSFLKSQLAFDAQTGTRNWISSEINGLSFAKIAVTEDAVFAGTAAVPGLMFDGFLTQGGLLKLNKHNGEPLWFFATPDHSYGEEFGVISGPLVQDNIAFFGALDGKYYAIKENVTEHPILHFSIDRDEVKRGEVIEISWDVIDQHQTSLNGESVSASGKLSVPVCAHQTFTLNVKGRLQEELSLPVTVKPASTINIAKFGSAAASSSEDEKKLNASFAIDGDPATRWGSAFEDGESITLDLGSSFTLEKIVLQWEGAFAKAFVIEGSENLTAWETVYETVENSGGVNEIENLDMRARYLRLTGSKRATQYGISLFEFQVFEKPDVRQLNKLESVCN